MQVNSTVKMNFDRIKQLNQAAIAALQGTAEGLHEEVQQAQVIPREKGTLQGEGTYVDNSQIMHGKVMLVSDTPYARRLYYHPEYKFSKEENPNARGKWYEDWLPGGDKADFVPKTFKEIYKMKGGM